MAHLFRSNSICTDSAGEFDALDHISLTSRRKLLLASKITTTSRIDVAVQKEEEEEDNEGLLSSPSACSVGGGTDQLLALELSHESEAPVRVTSEASNGDIRENSTADDQFLQKSLYGQDVDISGDCNGQRIHSDMNTCPDQITCSGLDIDVAGLKKFSVSVCTSYENAVLSSVPTEAKVENSGNHVFSSLEKSVNNFIVIGAPAVKVNTYISSDFADDDLDHIVLKERQRMLVRRRPLELEKGVVESNSIGLSEDLVVPGARRIKEETKSLDVEFSVAGDKYNETPAENVSGVGLSSVNASSEINIARSSFISKQCLEIPGCSLATEATKSRNNMVKSGRTSSDFSSCGEQHDVPESGSVHVPTLQTAVTVKAEPLENTDLLHSENNMSSTFSFNAKPVKGEMETTNKLCGDGVDHMRLQDRMKLLTSGENSDFESSRNPALQNRPVVSESAKRIRVNRPRKRKKTATDSVETAMEEDAPGLLQALVEQGVSVDEIKLYGEMEDDDALDETFNEDKFSELESVMTKLFFQRNSFLKFAPDRCAKGSKPSYCLACLFSLVEQTRYLQFRKWPVEWGWCRDLQSFIFVFKRHNRLVMERPEYGYATYFFELLDSLPIDWQIKRLVTTMKLTSCGRVNLIENKSLLVGEDLTEGEAKVLMEFGWVPNTGLGTMLNYRDRVFHDRKNEKETSEWRLKIGKLLVAGYNGGSIVSTSVPGNVVKCISAETSQIKLEF